MSAATTITNETTTTLPISSTHILQLIQAHLTESGLHQSCRTLQLESGVGAAGILPTSKSTLIKSAEEGLWGTALEILDGLDVERYRRGYLEDYLRVGDIREGVGGGDGGNDDVEMDCKSMITPLEKSIALAHEMAILELADGGEVELAYASLRMCSEMLDRCLPVDNKDDMEDDVEDSQFYNRDKMNAGDRGVGMISSRSGDVERRVTALSSLRTSAANDGVGALLPTDFYGPNNQNPQKRRHQIAKLLKRHVPEVPNQRLSSLLQQSVKWQCFTGTFPTVERLFQSGLENEQNEDSNNENLHDDDKKKKKKRKKNHHIERKFDLVLGNVNVAEFLDGKKRRIKSSSNNGVNAVERVPSRPSQTIRLGKKSYISSALFLPDGKGLVTGSSDGFVEIWGEPISSSTKQDVGDDKSDKLNNLLKQNIDFEKLRTSDLPYQKEDDLMLHDSSVLAMDVSRDGSLLGTASSDGTVCVWKISDGKLLRKLERTHGGSGGDKGAAVTCIQFSPNGSKLLTGGHDNTCREFGLLASRMLKEFRGHRSYVNCCSYVILPNASILGNNDTPGTETSGSLLVVVTGSADGTVCVWDGRTAEPLREITTPIPTSSTAVLHGDESVVSSKSVHTVFHLHSPPQTMIVVPRTNRAFLMSYSGTVLKVYSRDDVQECEFLAAAVSPSNLWLYVAADDGKCMVFDVNSGKVEKIIHSFAEECSSGRGDSMCDISGIIHHPHRGMIGGYSSDKGQKRGVLTLWK